MTYVDLPDGTTVFLDAGVFIHHFEPNPLFGPASTDLLERIENQQLSGVTSSHILSEVAHRLMTVEAMQDFGWKSAGIAAQLRSHLQKVKSLMRFRQAIQEILLFGIQILRVEPAWLDLAAETSQQTGLLHNDALLLVLMRANGLTNLASPDSDFQGITGIVLFSPP
jgi:predicted nucleic acid-binding protein